MSRCYINIRFLPHLHQNEITPASNATYHDNYDVASSLEDGDFYQQTKAEDNIIDLHNPLL